jgi:hypothetical protein
MSEVGKKAGFYVIVRDDDLRFVRHENNLLADQEAMRLASCNPGHKFYVLKTVREAERAVVVPPPPPPPPAGVTLKHIDMKNSNSSPLLTHPF